VVVRPCFSVVDDGGTFWRLKKRTFVRILLQHDDEVHPEFAGQRVKYAAINVGYDGRRSGVRAQRVLCPNHVR
jgi:hypothetical protein